MLRFRLKYSLLQKTSDAVRVQAKSLIAYKYLQSQGFGKDNLEEETTRQRVERMKIAKLQISL